eukprot:3782917-Pyramimonas_sp.AAC.1
MAGGAPLQAATSPPCVEDAVLRVKICRRFKATASQRISNDFDDDRSLGCRVTRRGEERGRKGHGWHWRRTEGYRAT